MRFSYKNILQIVWPLIVSGFGQSIIYVTDILFLGRLGETVLGASAIAGLFYASLMMVGFGISSGLQVLIAQKTGESKYEETHQYLLNGIFLQGVAALVFIWLYFLSNHLLMSVFVSNPEVKNATQAFLNIRIIGLFPYFLFYAYRAFYLGIGRTKIISIATILMSILNLILNPLLIYGWSNFIQPLNYVGSAWASVISEWISTFIIMIYYADSKKSIRFISQIKTIIWKETLVISTPLIFIATFYLCIFMVLILCLYRKNGDSSAGYF